MFLINVYTNYMKKFKYLNRLANTRIKIMRILTISICFLFVFTLFNLCIIKKDEYNKKLDIQKEITYYGPSVRRGNIYDKNMNLIVGSKDVRILIYKDNSSNEMSKALLSKKVSEVLSIKYDNITESMLKEYFYVLNNDKLIKRLDEEIINSYKNREINEEDYKNEIKKLITDDEIKNTDKKSSYIYYLMNNGYSETEKIIKENLNDREYALFNELESDYKGFKTDVKYERYYPHESTLRSVLGTVSNYGLPKENIEYYLNNDYILIDNVGISGIEKQYESYLRGKREKYYLNQFGEKVTIEPSSVGNDLVLTIDIKLQKEIEDIIVESLIAAKKERNTDYLNRSYVIISNPNTGEILASSSKRISYNKASKKYNISDNSINIALDSVTPGSIVKGASHLVGYTTNNLTIGHTINDSCIKIMNTPLKCSWTYLGKINDIKALKYSSNYYQYLIAIKVGKGNYYYNGPLSLNKNGFKIYRNMYNQFGLGVLTGIDLPYESVGYIGNDTNPNSLIDFAIGQYDTYTPIQLMQYINTIATSGKRYKMHYLDKVLKDKEIIYSYENNILNEVNAKNKYIERVKLGFKEVLEPYGTGYYYVLPKYKPAGKTGTSESFIDTDNDGSIDTSTLTHTFGVYAPYNNPTFSMIVVSPDIAIPEENYISYVNKTLSYKVSKIYFEKYK